MAMHCCILAIGNRIASVNPLNKQDAFTVVPYLLIFPYGRRTNHEDRRRIRYSLDFMMIFIQRPFIKGLASSGEVWFRFGPIWLGSMPTTLATTLLCFHRDEWEQRLTDRVRYVTFGGSLPSPRMKGGVESCMLLGSQSLLQRDRERFLF